MDNGGDARSNVIRPSEYDLRERRAKVLARRARLRPTDNPPPNLAHQLAAGVRYPLTWPHAPAGLAVRYRRSRWEDLDGRGTVRQRQITAWLMEGRERIGGVDFAEYDIAWAENDEVFLAMDPESTEAARLGDLLTICWESVFHEVACFGSVVEMETVWQKPRRGPRGAAVELAETFIADFWEKHAALVVAHAYPLEYEDAAWVGAPAEQGFHFRRAAMVRALERRFHMQRFPGKAGEIGLCWRARPGAEDSIEPPQLWAEPQTTLLF